MSAPAVGSAPTGAHIPPSSDAAPSRYDLVFALQNPLVANAAAGPHAVSSVSIDTEQLPPLNELHTLLTQGISADLCHALAIEYYKRGRVSDFEALLAHSQAIPTQTTEDQTAHARALATQAASQLATALALPLAERTIPTSAATAALSSVTQSLSHPTAFPHIWSLRVYFMLATQPTSSEALAAAETGLSSLPTDALGHLLTGVVRFARGEPKAALEAYSKALLDNPALPAGVRVAIGLCHVALNSLALARRSFIRALQLSPSCPDALIALALLELRLRLPSAPDASSVNAHVPEPLTGGPEVWASLLSHAAEVAPRHPLVLAAVAQHGFLAARAQARAEAAAGGATDPASSLPATESAALAALLARAHSLASGAVPGCSALGTEAIRAELLFQRGRLAHALAAHDDVPDLAAPVAAAENAVAAAGAGETPALGASAAVGLYRAALALAPGHAGALLGLGRLLLRAALAGADDVAAAGGAGAADAVVVARAAAAATEAIDTLTRAAAAAPARDPAVALALGHALLALANDPVAARPHLTAAAEALADGSLAPWTALGAGSPSASGVGAGTLTPLRAAALVRLELAQALASGAVAGGVARAGEAAGELVAAIKLLLEEAGVAGAAVTGPAPQFVSDPAALTAAQEQAVGRVAWHNLGSLQLQLGQIDAAAVSFARAVRGALADAGAPVPSAAAATSDEGAAAAAAASALSAAPAAPGLPTAVSLAGVVVPVPFPATVASTAFNISLLHERSGSLAAARVILAALIVSLPAYTDAVVRLCALHAQRGTLHAVDAAVNELRRLVNMAAAPLVGEASAGSAMTDSDAPADVSADEALANEQFTALVSRVAPLGGLRDRGHALCVLGEVCLDHAALHPRLAERAERAFELAYREQGKEDADAAAAATATATGTSAGGASASGQLKDTFALVMKGKLLATHGSEERAKAARLHEMKVLKQLRSSQSKDIDAAIAKHRTRARAMIGDALTKFNRALSLDPGCLPALLGLTSAAAELCSIDDATAPARARAMFPQLRVALTEARAARPRDTSLMINLAHFDTQEGLLADAILLYQNAITALEAEHATTAEITSVMLFLARAQHMAGQGQRSRRTLARALALAPGDEVLWYNMGIALEESALSSQAGMDKAAVAVGMVTVDDAEAAAKHITLAASIFKQLKVLAGASSSSSAAAASEGEEAGAAALPSSSSSSSSGTSSISLKNIAIRADKHREFCQHHAPHLEQLAARARKAREREEEQREKMALAQAAHEAKVAAEAAEAARIAAEEEEKRQQHARAVAAEAAAALEAALAKRMESEAQAEADGTRRAAAKRARESAAASVDDYDDSDNAEMGEDETAAVLSKKTAARKNLKTPKPKVDGETPVDESKVSKKKEKKEKKEKKAKKDKRDKKSASDASSEVAAAADSDSSSDDEAEAADSKKPTEPAYDDEEDGLAALLRAQGKTSAPATAAEGDEPSAEPVIKRRRLAGIGGGSDDDDDVPVTASKPRGRVLVDDDEE